ncbi:peroxidase-like [Mya arenaria]|uniref:peroxidase-like n=1 Tax=Mya arenaria TaxID=6604 RepID=UPI0022E3F4D0|nr:peroxidase-like [Mya arenaria]
MIKEVSTMLMFLVVIATGMVVEVGSESHVMHHRDLRHALDHAFQTAEGSLAKQIAINQEMHTTGVDGEQRRRRGHFINMFGWIKKLNVEQSKKAFILLAASKQISQLLGKTIKELQADPKFVKTWAEFASRYCKPRLPACDVATRYRTIDGSCNNIKQITWGMAERPQARYMPPVYHDGVGTPRQFSITGSPLPSARHVSNVLHNGGVSDLLEPVDSAMVMQWGQTLDHDMIDTPVVKGHKENDIQCCRIDASLRAKRAPCFHIHIPKGDPRFLSTCMNFVRSAPARDDFCKISQRQQINQATAVIDASYLYGTDHDTMKTLRTFKGGLLKMTDSGAFIPTKDQTSCERDVPSDYCMKSGDLRIHVVPSLASTQIMMLREHNRIATILGNLNTHWSDETVFQETRKIIAALNQHIASTEYMPIVLGVKTMSKYGLRSKPRGFNHVYNPKVDPTIRNSWGAASFRFAHSAVPGDIGGVNMKGIPRTTRLESTFNKPTMVLENGGRGSDDVNRWLTTHRGGKQDRFLEPAIRDFLFLDDTGQSFDLAALNIQRGRDHGIPGYNAWRKWCGLPVAFHFLSKPGGVVDIHPDAAKALADVYMHPDDIDLYSVGLAEMLLPGSRMGPTFACINARQFQDVKFGDRFWYENNYPRTGFTFEQLNEVKKMKLSNIMCHTQPTKLVARNLFEIPSKKNPLVECSHLEDMDLRHWKEHVYMTKGPYVPIKLLQKYF